DYYCAIWHSSGVFF
nr:immunoglobulin light chain junction region [Macaca mulatta]